MSLRSIFIKSMQLLRFLHCMLALAVFPVSVASAPASTIDLQCEGAWATHHNGFGRTEVNWSEIKSRLLTIDERTSQIRMQTLFGERGAQLGEQKDDRYFSFRIPLEVEYQGRTVLAESVLVNRVTGEVSAMYDLAPLQSLSTSFLSFSGKCKRAQRQF